MHISTYLGVQGTVKPKTKRKKTDATKLVLENLRHKNIFDATSVVAKVGGAGRACPGPTIFAQHSEQKTSCRPAQIVHSSLI